MVVQERKLVHTDIKPENVPERAAHYLDVPNSLVRRFGPTRKHGNDLNEVGSRRTFCELLGVFRESASAARLETR